MAEEIKIRIRHEKLQPRHEAGKTHEQPAKHHEQAGRHANQKKLEHIRAVADKEALSAREIAPKEEDTSHLPRQAFVNHELKVMAYERTLSRVRRQLSGVNRLTSKVIHQPVVNAVSEVTARTVGRPSGLLGGGFVALAGTAAYYYITKHYGYEYSYTAFLALLGAGIVAGWLFEALYRLLRLGK